MDLRLKAIKIINRIPVNLILMPMHKCNLRCVYCYARSWNSPYTKPMSNQVLDKTLALYAEYLDEYRFNTQVLIHGYEPLQYGHHRMEYIFNYLRRTQTGRSLEIAVQTNGTLIDDDYVDIFRKYKIDISISIDGPKYIHDKLRSGSYDKAIEGFKLVKNAGLAVGIISVITKLHMGKAREYYSWLKEHEITSAFAHPLIKIKDSPWLKKYYVSPSEALQFYIDLYEMWKKDITRISLRPFTTFISTIVLRKPTICTFQAQCYQWISIDPNGDVWLCSGDKSLVRIGNIMKYNKFDKMLIDNYKTWLIAYIRAMKLASSVCRKCPYFNFCRGGCMHSAYEFTGSLYQRDPLACNLYMPLFKLIYNDIKQSGLLEKYRDIIERSLPKRSRLIEEIPCSILST